MGKYDGSFYAWEDCERCKGTGYVPVADCYCSKCKQRYVKELEQIIAANGDDNDYSNPVVVFATYTAITRNEEE